MKAGKENILILLSLLVIIFVLGVFLFNNMIDYLSVLEKKEVYANIIVSDHYGVDVNSSALVFGMTLPGGSSVRETTLTNEHNQEVNVELFVEGDIKEFLQISENNFNLKSDESRKIFFTAFVPKDKELGTYDGKVIFVIKNIIVK